MTETISRQWCFRPCTGDGLACKQIIQMPPDSWDGSRAPDGGTARAPFSLGQRRDDGIRESVLNRLIADVQTTFFTCSELLCRLRARGHMGIGETPAHGCVPALFCQGAPREVQKAKKRMPLLEPNIIRIITHSGQVSGASVVRPCQGQSAVFEQHLVVPVSATLGRLPLGLGGSLRAAQLPLPAGCLGGLLHHDLGLPFPLLLTLGGDLRAIVAV